MTTVKEIHNAFYADVCKVVSERQQTMLRGIGFNITPPNKYLELFSLHKIIHINTILRLCEKYDLRFGNTDDYVGSIPQKNIDEVEKFINQYQYVHLTKESYSTWSGFSKKSHHFIKEPEKNIYKHDQCISSFKWRIVAPSEMLVSEKWKSRDGSYEKDPIIIAMIVPELGKDDFYFSKPEWGVIVTAWGDEASDEAVVNEKMN